MATCCKTCIHSRWELTASGRIQKRYAGRCVVPVVLPTMPQCVRDEVRVSRMGIWPNDGDACPLYQENQGKPIER